MAKSRLRAERHPIWMMSRSPTPDRLLVELVPVRVHREDLKAVFDINPQLTEEDRQAIQHEQHAALADGIGA